MKRKGLGRPQVVKEWIFPPPLKDNDIQVLYILARNEPLNMYQIAKKIAEGREGRKSLSMRTRTIYSSVHKSVKELEERELITSHETKETEKGTMADYFDLNLQGVMFLLRNGMHYGIKDKFDYSFVSRILTKYRDLLPLVFGKWKHFEKMKVKKIALFRLWVLVCHFDKYPSDFRGGTGFSFGMGSTNMEHLASWYFFFQGNHFKYGKHWVDTLKQDEEIIKYVIKELKIIQKRVMNQYTVIGITISNLMK